MRVLVSRPENWRSKVSAPECLVYKDCKANQARSYCAGGGHIGWVTYVKESMDRASVELVAARPPGGTNVNSMYCTPRKLLNDQRKAKKRMIVKTAHTSYQPRHTPAAALLSW